MLNRQVAVLLLLALLIIPGMAQGAEDSQTLYEKGKAALEAGMPDEAAAIFSALIGTDPQAAVYYHRGRAYSAANKDALALQDFEKAASMEPDKAIYSLSKGISLAKNGNYQDSIKSFSKVLELDPENVQAFSGRAKALFTQGQNSAAMEDLTQAIKRNPNDASYYRLRGDILSSAGEHDSAVQDYDIAIRLRPDDATAHNNRGVALANLGKIKEAVEDLNKAMDMATAAPSQAHVPGISGNPW
jgi:tetratricopeptide (TPR) repeat protein